MVLVPYRKEHVRLYHAWMEDEQLREATASERLTLQQEYEMQEAWARDDDKCTFIILDKARPGDAATGSHGAMAGDVNLFFNDPEEPSTSEIEIMVADGRSRRKGIAREALDAMMRYAVTSLDVAKFRAKIGVDNAPSLALFDKLGFARVSYSEIFREVALECAMDERSRAALRDRTQHLVYGTYDGDGGRIEAE